MAKQVVAQIGKKCPFLYLKITAIEDVWKIELERFHSQETIRLKMSCCRKRIYYLFVVVRVP